MDSIQFKRLDATHISARTIEREIKAVLKLQIAESSNSQDVDITLYGADSSNDIESLLLRFFVKLFKMDSTRIAAKAEQLGSLNEVIYFKLCAVPENAPEKKITIDVALEGVESTITLERMGCNQVKVQIGNKTPAYINTTFEAIKEKFATHFAHQLKDTVCQLDTDHRIAWLDVNYTDEQKNEAEISYHISEQTEYADFTKIEVIHETNVEPTDTGTMVRQDGLFATTLVDGGADKLTNRSNELPIFSAAVTTAAMHSVKCGILKHGLQGDTVDTFFSNTLTLLLRQNDIKADWPAFHGVIYYKQRGVCRTFEYTHKDLLATSDSDTLPNGDLEKIKEKRLIASTNANARQVLTVSIDVRECIRGRDDFDFYRISNEADRSTTKKGGILFGKCRQFAEEYDGHDHEKFNHQIIEIERLGKLKIALVEAHIELLEARKKLQIQEVKQTIEQQCVALISELRIKIAWPEDIKKDLLDAHIELLEGWGNQLTQEEKQTMEKQWSARICELQQKPGDAEIKLFLARLGALRDQEKKVHGDQTGIVAHRASVLEKLTGNLERAKESLAQAKANSANENKLLLLEKTVSNYQEKVEYFEKQDTEIEQMLAEQKEIDKILINRKLEKYYRDDQKTFDRQKLEIERLGILKNALLGAHTKLLDERKNPQEQKVEQIMEEQCLELISALRQEENTGDPSIKAFHALLGAARDQQKKVHGDQTGIVAHRAREYRKLLENSNGENQPLAQKREGASNENKLQLEDTLSDYNKKVNTFLNQQQELSKILNQQKEIDESLTTRKLMKPAPENLEEI